jgi:HSP20 family protein
MTLIRRQSPFNDLLTLRHAMDRVFEDSFLRSPFWTGSTPEGGAIPLDITSTADALVVEAALPGVRPEDVDITVESGTLSISGTFETEASMDEGDQLIRELRRGTFTRSITLPQGLEPDRAEATFENGILRLRLPKAEQVKPRQIKITAAPTTETVAVSAGSEQS